MSFYIDLISDIKAEGFSNRPNHFKNDLPMPIELEGLWEVGLAECFFHAVPLDVKQKFKEGSFKVIQYDNANKERKIVLGPYTIKIRKSIYNIVAQVNELLKQLPYVYSRTHLSYENNILYYESNSWIQDKRKFSFLIEFNERISFLLNLPNSEVQLKMLLEEGKVESSAISDELFVKRTQEEDIEDYILKLVYSSDRKKYTIAAYHTYYLGYTIEHSIKRVNETLEYQHARIEYTKTGSNSRISVKEETFINIFNEQNKFIFGPGILFRFLEKFKVV